MSGNGMEHLKTKTEVDQHDDIQNLTQQLAEAQAHIEQLRESLAILVDLLAHKDESSTRAMPDAWDVARGCLELTPAQSLQEVKADALREFGEHQGLANEQGYSLDIYEYADKLEQDQQLRQQGEE